jgi:hypothetical protein
MKISNRISNKISNKNRGKFKENITYKPKLICYYYRVAYIYESIGENNKKNNLQNNLTLFPTITI